MVSEYYIVVGDILIKFNEFYNFILFTYFKINNCKTIEYFKNVSFYLKTLLVK